jgi:hypothetical protein
MNSLSLEYTMEFCNSGAGGGVKVSGCSIYVGSVPSIIKWIKSFPTGIPCKTADAQENKKITKYHIFIALGFELGPHVW